MILITDPPLEFVVRLPPALMVAELLQVDDRVEVVLLRRRAGPRRACLSVTKRLKSCMFLAYFSRQ